MAKKSAEKSTMSKAKGMVVDAAEAVAGAVSDAAKSAKKHVVLPVAEAVGLIETKPAAKKKAPAKPVAKAEPVKTAPKKAAVKATPTKPEAKKAAAPAKSSPAKKPPAKAKGAK